MVHYRCDDCGVFFDEPTVTHYSESLNGQIRRNSEEQCPACDCDSFSEVNECPTCKKSMLTTDRFCYPCWKALNTRVISFFDTLTAEEEQQFDDWMTGEAVLVADKPEPPAPAMPNPGDMGGMY